MKTTQPRPDAVSRRMALTLLLSLAALAGGIAPLRADPVPLNQDATVETNVTAGVWIHYEVAIPSDSPGWRLVLAPRGGSAGNVQLYVRKDSLPTTGSYFRRDNTAGTLKTMVLNAAEATAGTWYVGLYLSGGAAEDVLLQSETGWLTELTWDPGDEELGTEPFAIPEGDVGGLHYFRIVTPNSRHGIWRQVLEVNAGEADLYIRQSAVPSTSSYTARSIRTGSDGILRALSTTAGAGQVWYVMVVAQPGAEWNLFVGDLFVQDLGEAQADGSGGSGPDVMPIEGARFYQAAIPQGTLAWRLWLQDGVGATWRNDLFIRKNAVGHPLITTPERTYSGQGLVVPPYLTTETDAFFVSLNGDPGTAFALDSRQQAVTDLAIDTTSALVEADGYWFHTYRIEVPPDRLGWEVTVRREDGNPDLAVRKGQVPNTRYNDAFSEVAGAVDDSITLVQTDLGDGVYFATVHSTDAHAFRLQTREPVLTPITFTDTKLNDDPDRTGWRYYGMTDIESQQGFLGWLLELADQVPGTEIAIRRNNLPGRWSRRINNSVSTIARVDDSSTVGILQRPGHAADVWYVGVRTATAALGPFTLNTAPLTAPLHSIESSGAIVSNLPPNIFAFYRIDVPAVIGEEDLLGWELRVPTWTGANPEVYIRRGQLPIISGAPGFPLPGVGSTTSWPIGVQISERNNDWTGRTKSSDGIRQYASQLLSFALGQPLEPGTYYIGFRNTSTTVDATFSWTSRAIGEADSGLDYEVKPLVYGEAVEGALAAREVAYYAMDIPEGTPGQKLRLTLPEGHEGSLYIRKDYLPNSKAGNRNWWDPSNPLGDGSYHQTRLAKAGGEVFVHLPRAGATNILAGRYYLMVVSEGQNPTANDRIGTGSISYTLQSLGPAPVEDLGVLPEAGETTFADSYAAGEVKLYRFAIPEDVLALEVVLVDRVGDPQMALNAGDIVRARLGWQWYGWNNIYGYSCAHEVGYGQHANVLTVANPAAGDYSLVVGHVGSTPAVGAYTLRVTTVGAPLVDMDGGGGTGIALLPNAWCYHRVEVPAQIGGKDVLGWEVHVPEWAGASVETYIRRDDIPGTGAPGFPSPGFGRGTNWPSGTQISETAYDWTRRQYSADGSQGNASVALGFGMGQPLEPGTYFIGFRNSSATLSTTFSWTSRAIGAQGSGFAHEVLPLAFGGEAAADGPLAARQVAYYAMDIPEGTPGQKLRLTLPEGHEGSLYIRKDYLPNSKAASANWWDPSNPLGWADCQQTRLAQAGGEVFVHLPRAGATNILAGRYYLMVVSEGQNPTRNDRIGTGSIGYTLQSLGPAPVADRGALAATDTKSLPDSYEAGEVKLYHFSIPEDVLALEVRLLDREGGPHLALNAGDIVRARLGWYWYGWNNIYGYSCAHEEGYGLDANVLTVANPSAGDYSLAVGHVGTTPQAGSYTLRVTTVGAPLVDMDGGGGTGIALLPNAWCYYRVEVPAQIGGEDVLGWEVHVPAWAGASVETYIRRDELPGTGAPALPSPGFARSTSWPSGVQIGETTYDWTRRTRSADGALNVASVALGFGMGQPLEPGTYFIGFRNSSATLSTTFSWTSRAIGAQGSGFAHEVLPLAFGGDAAAGGPLAARLVAYYAMDIPEGTPSQKLRLTLPEGHEGSLYIRKDYLPNSRAASANWWDPSNPLGGADCQQTRLAQAGGEVFVHLPRAGATNILAGRYYLMVVSEGQNPTANDRIGTNSVSYTLQSLGPAPVADLGALTAADTATLPDGFDAGEVKLYRFEIPEEVLTLEVRLENRVGSPRLGMNAGGILRQQLNYLAHVFYDAYGLANARQSHYGVHDSILTVVNPPAGSFSVGVYHGANNPAVGAYTLRATTIQAITLAPAGTGSTSAALQLAPEQRRYYVVDVPEEWNGQSVLGWKLTLNALSGSAQMRIRPGAVPSGDGTTGQTAWRSPSMLVVPPFLAPGAWYVEVQGVTDTEVTLTSSLVTTDDLQRQWEMPPAGEPSDAPGMSGAWFGDSGIDADGKPLPGDQGVDLPTGAYHLFVIDVPEGNGGLLRTVLEAIGGNPDLYVRPGLLPSLSHNANGGVGAVMHQHRLDAATQTEYGSWVPLDVRTATELAAGTWYLMVHAAGDSNARYRLRLSHHAEPTVRNLALDGGSLADQFLVASDWRYYRVDMPVADSDMPLEWTISFDLTQGSILLCLRDTAPPGQWERKLTENIRDWGGDSLNPGNYPRYSNPGSYTIDGRHLRPGKTYFLGFRAAADAVFSVQSGIGAETVADLYGVIDTVSAAGGGASVELAPGEVRTWRVESPAQATRWLHTSTHAGVVQVYLREHFLPTLSAADPWRSNGAANSTRTSSYGSDLRPRTFYLSAHNTSAEPQPYTFEVEWRPEYTLTYLAGAGGSVAGATPQAVHQDESGTAVEAVPEGGAVFHRWSDGSETAGRTDATVRANLTVTARFRTVGGADIDWYAARGIGPGPEEDWSDVDAREVPEKGTTLQYENIADTDPNNPVDRFRIIAFDPGPPATVKITFGSSARVYTLMTRTNLLSGGWQSVPGTGPRPGAGVEDTFADGNEPRKGPFYRVKVELP